MDPRPEKNILAKNTYKLCLAAQNFKSNMPDTSRRWLLGFAELLKSYNVTISAKGESYELPPQAHQDAINVWFKVMPKQTALAAFFGKVMPVFSTAFVAEYKALAKQTIHQAKPMPVITGGHFEPTAQKTWAPKKLPMPSCDIKEEARVNSLLATGAHNFDELVSHFGKDAGEAAFKHIVEACKQAFANNDQLTSKPQKSAITLGDAPLFVNSAASLSQTWSSPQVPRQTEQTENAAPVSRF